jgi:nickel superoxide dismutase
MFKFPEAQAHCDIPCKIYDPCVAQVAALSIIRLMDLIAELGDLNTQANATQLARLASQKESHAAQVKHDVTTIWGDYFKQPQIERFPQIHKVTHGIMQAASKCKQGTMREDGIELLSQLNQFAELFWHSKDIPTQSVIAPYPPKLKVVHPILARA